MAYKTIAQNLADSSTNLLKAIAKLEDTAKLEQQLRDANAEVLRLRAELAKRSTSVTVGGVIAVPSR